MAAHAAQLREIAKECRVLAVVAKSPEIREQLLDVAEQFDRLARHRDFVEMTTVTGSPRLKSEVRSEEITRSLNLGNTSGQRRLLA